MISGPRAFRWYLNLEPLWNIYLSRRLEAFFLQIPLHFTILKRPYPKQTMPRISLHSGEGQMLHTCHDTYLAGQSTPSSRTPFCLLLAIAISFSPRSPILLLCQWISASDLLRWVIHPLMSGRALPVKWIRGRAPASICPRSVINPRLKMGCEEFEFWSRSTNRATRLWCIQWLSGHFDLKTSCEEFAFWCRSTGRAMRLWCIQQLSRHFDLGGFHYCFQWFLTSTQYSHQKSLRSSKNFSSLQCEPVVEIVWCSIRCWSRGQDGSNSTQPSDVGRPDPPSLSDKPQIIIGMP